MVINWEESRWSPKSLAFITKPIEEFKKIVLLAGAVRSSKTVNVVIKSLEYAAIMGRKGTIGVIGVTKDTVHDNMLTDIFDIVGTGNYRYNRQTGDLILLDNIRCKVIGAKDKGSEKYLRGKTLAGAIVDELTQIPYDFFKQLINRCSIPGSRIFATTNPDTPTHWVKRDFIDDMRKAGIFEYWHFTLDDNWNLTPDYIETIKQAYSGVFYDRMIEGMWVVAEGRVFQEFDPKTHVIKSTDLHIYSEFFCGIDFGFSNPSCITVWGVTRKGEFHCLYEFYETQKITQDLISWINELEKNMPKRPRWIFCDPAEPDRINEMSRSIRIKGAHVCYPADNAIMSGLNCLKTNFKNDNIKIHKRCVNLINELSTLRWPTEDEPGYQDEKKFVGEDHACDSSRYALFTYCKRILGYKY